MITNPDSAGWGLYAFTVLVNLIFLVKHMVGLLMLYFVHANMKTQREKLTFLQSQEREEKAALAWSSGSLEAHALSFHILMP